VSATPRRKVASRPVADPALPWRLSLNNILLADVYALQALERGQANAAQQQRAIAFVVYELCAVDRMSFYPGAEDGRRASDFAEGKRWVGCYLRRILKLRPDHRAAVGIEPREPPAPPAEPAKAETTQE
jgi:hypothetical protein